jgi:subtilisin
MAGDRICPIPSKTVMGPSSKIMMFMDGYEIERRQVLRFAGAGALVGGFTGNAAGRRGQGAYIVGATSNAAVNEARSRADAVAHVIDLGEVTAVAGNFSEQAIDALSRRTDVEYVEEDRPMRALDTEVDAAWGVDRVDAEVAHANDVDDDGSNETGNGAHVAVIDTGIDSDHPDLDDNLGDGHAVVSARGPYSEEWDDDNGHGTHCAGIAGAEDNGSGVVGVAPGSTLHAVKVLDKNGSGRTSDVVAGIDWVTDKESDWGPTVASLSLGGGDTQTLQEACQNAQEAGVLVVAAAGNDGNTSACDDNDCVAYPAAYSSVVAVSATNRCDEVSPWSSVGPEIELAAPGAVIRSTVPGGYDTKSGTSMACPHVSGAGAVLMADGTSAGTARTTLQDSAETVEHDPNGSDTDSSYGHGLLDVANAVGVASDDDMTPVVTTEPATDVDDTSATLNGSIDSKEIFGCATEATAHFEWRNPDSDTYNTTAEQTVTKDSNLNFDETVTGLSSDTTYEFRAVVTETAENGWSVTGYGSVKDFTTGSGDGDGGSDGGDTTDPTGAIDDDNVESLNPNNPHAEYSVPWTANDEDDNGDPGELSSVTVELRRINSDGSKDLKDSVTTSVSGSSASDTTEVSDHKGDGYDHEIRLIVEDAAGNVADPADTWSSSTS